jgi:hypothetical protein
MGYNPAERVIFSQIDFPDTSGIMSDGIEQRSSPRRHSSCYPKLSSGISRPAVFCDIGALGTPWPKKIVLA